MPFTSVSIHETYELLTPIGSLWRKIEASYEIGEGEDEYTARDKVKAFLDESHKKYCPELPQQSAPPKFLNINTGKMEY